MASAVDEVAAPPRKLLIDRLREAAEAPPEYSEPPPELVQWSTTTFYSGVAAFFLGGFAGARKEAEKHIVDNKATVYQSKMSAQRDVNYAAARGFVRQGSKWGLQMMGFTALFTGVYLYLQDYRDKRDILNMSVGGSATGAVMGITKGLRSVPKGLALGTVLGTVGGAMMHGVWWLEDIVDTPEMKSERLLAKQLERQEKERLYHARLAITNTIVQDLESQLAMYDTDVPKSQ